MKCKISKVVINSVLQGDKTIVGPYGESVTILCHLVNKSHLLSYPPRPPLSGAIISEGPLCGNLFLKFNPW